VGVTKTLTCSCEIFFIAGSVEDVQVTLCQHVNEFFYARRNHTPVLSQ
jgi:predicted secreted protein